MKIVCHMSIYKKKNIIFRLYVFVISSKRFHQRTQNKKTRKTRAFKHVIIIVVVKTNDCE